MSKIFVTNCPHCNEKIAISYSDIMRDLGVRSLSKRKIDSESMRTMSRKRYPEGHLHPKQHEILKLAQSVDLSTLTYKQIAEKVGVTGKHVEHNVFIHLKRLDARGLLPFKPRLVHVEEGVR